jgi:hypothetical protein
LQYIRIPENLKTLGTQVFERCYNLVEVENHSKHFSVERRTTANGYIGRYAINISNPGETFTHKVAKEGDFYVVNLENEKVVFDYVGSETHWTFPADATSIHDGAFLQREDVIGVTFGNKLKSIGDSAFEQCKNLTSVIIPDSVEKIESSAFNSSGLCTAVVGNGLTALPYQAFSGCSQLVSIVIGKNVQTIKQNAFNQTEKLVEVINYSSHLTIEKGVSTNHYLGYYAVSVYNGQAPYESKVTLDANGFYVLFRTQDVQQSGNRIRNDIRMRHGDLTEKNLLGKQRFHFIQLAQANRRRPFQHRFFIYDVRSHLRGQSYRIHTGKIQLRACP